ncbi:GNAT family N-acetyltransferase [Bradyrhizobium japonicum]|uniref:GNAT family N-acetyltransferase n=1 Tax=Bradyrhizobium japonicum TaxID=375 RepID=UPI0009B6644D|nr:N-acetyltransferase [Bradyrhizobium japonicum]
MKRVRPARLGDVTLLQELEVASFSEGFRAPDNFFKSVINDQSDAILLVAEIDNRVCGYVMAMLQDGSSDHIDLHASERSVWQIVSVAVHPERRGEGLAASLLEEAILRAGKQGGCARIIAEAHVNNVASIALLTASGFQPIKRLSRYYGNADGIRYDRPLFGNTRPKHPAPRLT